MNPTFIIELIVRARNELAGVMDRAAADVDKVTKAQERNAASNDKVTKAQNQTRRSLADTQARYAEFTKEIEKGNVSYESAISELKKFKQELDGLRRSAPAGSELSRGMDEASRSVQTLSENITNHYKEQERLAKEAADAEERRAQESIELEKRREQERVAAIKAGEERVMQILQQSKGAREEQAAAEVAAAEAEAKRQEDLAKQRRQIADEFLADTRRELDERDKIQRAASDYAIKEDSRVESSRAAFRAKRMAEDDLEVRHLGQNAAKSRGFIDSIKSSLHGLLSGEGTPHEGIEERIKGLNEALSEGRFSTIAFAANLRSLIYVGVFAFFQQLVGVAGALAGSLVAVASAAGQAASALVGMASAGAAQALPVVGLLVAAFGRIGAVFKAVQQNQKAATKSSYDNQQALDKQRQSTEQVASAQQSLSDAQRSVADAQKALTDARRAAVRQLTDLINAEKSAQLAAEGAVLSQSRAQEALKQSIASGDISSLAENSLAVRQAGVDVDTSRIAANRATVDANRARSRGVEGSDQVVAASRALDQARRSVTQASQALADARQQAKEATSDFGAAQRQLQQMLARLSPAERDLYDSLNRIYKRYRDVFIGDGQHTGILGSIIEAFTYGVDRGTKLLGDRRILSAASSLSDELGKQIRRGFNFLSSDRNINFFAEMSRDAKENLGPVNTILTNLFKLVRNFAQAGAPALHQFLLFLGQITGEADRATGSNSGIAKLQAFFSQGEKYAEDFIRLGAAIGRLFLAIVGAGAKAGDSAINSIIESLNDATDYINTHRKDVQEFFDEALRATGYVLKAVGALSVAIFSLFHADQVKTFSEAIQTSVLPVLLNVTRVMGLLTKLFLTLISTPLGGGFFQAAATAGLLYKTLAPVVALFGRFLVSMGEFAGAEAAVAAGSSAIRLSLGNFGKMVALVSGILLVINGHFEDLGTVLKDLAYLLIPFLITKLVRGGGLAGAFEKAAAVGLSGRFGQIGIALGGVLSRVTGLISKLPILGRLFGSTAAAAEASNLGAATSTAGGAVFTRGTTGTVTRAGERAATGAAVGAGEGAAAGAGAAGVAKIGNAALLRAGIVAAGAFDVGSQIITGNSPARKFADTSDKNFFGLSTTGGGFKSMLRDLQSWSFQQSQAETAARKFGDTAKAAYDKLLSQRNTAGLDRMAEQARKLGDAWGPGRDALNKFADAAQKAADKFRPLTTALSNLGREGIKRIQGSDIINPNAASQFAGVLERIRKYGVGSITELRSDLAFNIDKITDAFRDGSKAWADAMVRNFGAGIQGVKGLLDEGQINHKKYLEEIRRQAKINLDALADKMRDATARGDKAAVQNIGEAAQGIGSRLKSARAVTKREMDQIQSLLVQGLIGYGFTRDQAVNIQKTGNLEGQRTGTGNEGGAGLEYPKATGGFIGLQGERGGDAIHTILGRGEAVLNFAHQKLVDPALRAAYGFGLPELFQRVNGMHGASLFGGMARGGFVAEPGTDFSHGQEPQIAAALRRLGQLMHATIYGISGYRTPQHSVAVGGFANDPHTRGAAADIGINSAMRSSAAALSDSLLRQVGLYRPYYPQSAAEINHVELIRGARDAIGVAGAAVQSAVAAIKQTVQIRNVRLGGPPSALRTMLQRGIGINVRAANQRLRTLAPGISAGLVDNFGASSLDIARTAVAQGRHMGATAKVLLSGIEAGIVESGLKNLLPGQGDRDSVGVLQQRPSQGWTGLNNVPKAFAEFFSRAIPLASKYGTAGQLAQAVQRSAYPDRYDAVRSQAIGILHKLGVSGFTRGGFAWGGWHGNGLSGVFKRPTLLGVGEKGPEAVTVKPMAAGGYTTPAAGIPDVTTGLRELAKAMRAIGGLKTGGISSKATDTLSKSITALIGDGGVLDQLSDAVSTLTTNLATNLTLATYKVTKSGRVIQKLDPAQVADRSLSNLQAIYQILAREQDALEKELAATQRRLKAKGLNAGQRKVLETAVNNIEKRLSTIDASIADNIQSTFDAIETQISARTDKADKAAGLGTGALDIIGRIQTLIGGTAFTAGGGSNRGLGLARAGVLEQQIKGYEDALRIAQRQGHTDTANDLVSKIQDLKLQIEESIEKGISDDVDEINRQAQRTGAALDVRNRIAQALGLTGQLGQIAVDRVNAISGQITQLIGQRDAASAGGFGALAEQINDQIKDLYASIIEVTSQALSDAVDQVNNAAARQSGLLDIQDRLANIIEKTRGVIPALGVRAGILGSRIDNLQNQRQGISGLLATAYQEGNQGQIDKLSDALLDLDTQIQENVEALRENNVQLRQARIDAITQRSSFLTGTFGNLNSLLGSLGSLTGTTDVGGQRGLIQQIIGTLSGSGDHLRDELFKDFGVDVRGQDASTLVRTLSSLNYDGIEASLAPDDKAQFESLIGAVIDNATAVVQNTDQLKQLTQPTDQGFTSTAWQWFRNAIFNGAGGLLTQYQIPSMDTGGSILRDGYIYGHAGEMIVKAAQVKRDGGAAGGDFTANINVTEQVEDAHPDIIASRLLFAYKNRPTT